MNWEQKLDSLNAITETVLKMRKPGDWYVSANRREIKNGGTFSGSYGNGVSPEEAVNDDWNKMTSISPEEEIVIDAMGNRELFRWNGWRWVQSK